MTKKLEKALEKARHVRMTDEDREAQKRSFVYGNTKLENKVITRELVNSVAESRRSGQSDANSVAEPRSARGSG